MNSPDSAVYRQPAGLDVHEADDGLIIFNPETDSVHHLNSTAGVLFLLCETPRDYTSLLDSFTELFEGQVTQTADLDEALSQLVEDGALIKA